ncbi:MAG: hypothetical protein AAGE18_01515 [Pseudomonadota bacterium]
MKAAVCRAVRAPLEIEAVTLPPPGPGEIGPGEIEVRVAARTLCHSDRSAADGDGGDAGPGRGPTRPPRRAPGPFPAG